MSLTMRTILLMCLASTANMFQMDQSEAFTPSEALAMLLMSNDQSAAFNPSNLAASRPVASMRSPSNSISRPMTARAALPIMEDEAPTTESPAEETETQKPSAKTKLEDIEIGGKVMGKVTSVQTFGVFMDIGATSDGLLHISEISDDYVDPEKFVEMFSEGDEKEVTVVEVDMEKKNIRLSSKEKKPALTPLSELEIGQEVEGVVRSTVSYGAFIDIGAKSDGLLHVSELSEGGEFIDDASKVVSPGDKVKCRIMAINLDKNQVSLTKKAPGSETRAPQGPSRAEKKALYEKYSDMNDKEFIPGKVSSIMSFGAFVNLEDGVDGLVHISEITEGRVEDVNAVLSIGDEVNVRVKGVDMIKQQIALSMKEWKEPSEMPSRGGDDFSGFNMDESTKVDDSPFDDLVVLDDDRAANVFESAFNKARTMRIAKSRKQKSQYEDKNLDMAFYLSGNSRRRSKKVVEESKKEEEEKDIAEEEALTA